MNDKYPIYYSASSLVDYIECIERCYNEWNISKKPCDGYSIWFRGESDDYSLLPTVLRDISGNRYNEFAIYNSFISIYKNYTNERFNPYDDDMFSFMQHYGIPTRLLDWTESYLAALFFSIDNVKDSGQPFVWVLNTGGLNTFSMSAKIEGPLVTPNSFIQARFDLIGCLDNEEIREKKYYEKNEEYEGYYRKGYLDYPLAYHPHSSGNNRIINQKGMFTVHGIKRNSIDNMFIENNKTEYLKKILITKSAIEDITESLRRAGITPRSIYPDLYGLSKELKSRFYLY